MTLSRRQRTGLIRIGETLIAADGDLPGFEESGCLAHIEEMLRQITASDAADIRLLGTICGVLPRVAVHALLRSIAALARTEGSVGAWFWRVDIGIRALFMTLYYGHDPVLECLGYDVCVKGDIP
jgi:hypothetical protein